MKKIPIIASVIASALSPTSQIKEVPNFSEPRIGNQSGAIAQPPIDEETHPVLSHIVDTSRKHYKNGINLNETRCIWTSTGPEEVVKFNPRDESQRDILKIIYQGFNEELKSAPFVLAEKSAFWCSSCWYGKPYFKHIVSVFSDFGLEGFSYNGSAPEFGFESPGVTLDSFSETLKKHYGLEDLINNEFPQFFLFEKGSPEIREIGSFSDLRREIQEAMGIKAPLPKDFLHSNENSSSLAFDSNNALFILDQIAKNPEKVSYLPDPVSRGFFGWNIQFEDNSNLVNAFHNKDTNNYDYTGRRDLIERIDNPAENDFVKRYSSEARSISYSVPSEEQLNSFLERQRGNLNGKIEEFDRASKKLRELRNEYAEINLHFPGSSDLKERLQDDTPDILILSYGGNTTEALATYNSINRAGYDTHLINLPLDGDSPHCGKLEFLKPHLNEDCNLYVSRDGSIQEADIDDFK